MVLLIPSGCSPTDLTTTEGRLLQDSWWLRHCQALDPSFHPPPGGKKNKLLFFTWSFVLVTGSVGALASLDCKARL